MALIRGNSANSGMEIAENDPAGSWGTVLANNATSPNEWKSIPLISETLTLDRALYPKSKEFGESGAQPFLEYGRGEVKGQIVIQGRYNQEWFWNLIAQFMGSEFRVADKDLEGGATVGSGLCSIHAFYPSATQSKGFEARVWKLGDAVGSGSNYVELFTGLIINRIVWDQPDGDIAKLTLDVTGKSLAYIFGNAANLPGNPSAIGLLGGSTAISPIYVKARDLSYNPPVVAAAYSQGTNFSFFGLGVSSSETSPTSMKQQNFTGFTLTMDRHVTAEGAFANDPDSPEQPGPTETRDIDLEIRGQLEDTYLAADKPYRFYVDKVRGKARIIYASTAVVSATGAQKYVIMIDMPNILFTEAKASLSEPGAPPSNFKAKVLAGTFANPTSHQSGTPDNDIRILCAVRPNEEPSTPFKWSVVTGG